MVGIISKYVQGGANVQREKCNICHLYVERSISGMVANNISLSWEHFKVAFFYMYFPKEQESLHLKHRRMLVAKFTKKFEELGRFYSRVLYELSGSLFKSSILRGVSFFFFFLSNLVVRTHTI